MPGAEVELSLCKLCVTNPPSAEAHIIPKSMYPFEKPRHEPLRIVASAPEVPLGKSRVGEYDPNLVCTGCEARFSPWDDYAIRLFRRAPKNEDYIFVDGKQQAYMIHTYDYAKLKLFFVSTLWRASETDRPFFANVNVGPRHTKRLREMILNSNPGEPEEYSVLIVRFTHPFDAHKAIMTPERQRYGSDRVLFYRFYLAGYMSAIKVSQQPTPSIFSRFILRPNRPLYIVLMRFEDTQDYQAMVKAVRSR